jgi:hypothetical protein
LKAIIAGSRSITSINDVSAAIELSGWSALITEVVCGMAQGADLLGKRWAQTWNIPVTEMPADWEQFGRKAGYKRNWQMADYAADGVLILIWSGTSTGSRAMRNIARERNIPSCVYIPSGETPIEI